MVPPSHSHAAHGQELSQEFSHEHSHGHGHRHDPATPHPAQPAPWSILRMPVAARLAAAAGASAALWAIVWLAMH